MEVTRRPPSLRTALTIDTDEASLSLPPSVDISFDDVSPKSTLSLNVRDGAGEGVGVFREFASATMLRMLFHDRTTNKNNMKPISKTHHAAVLFADISGFTRLSASLSEDDLRKHINNYFSKLLSVIQEHNGDVVKFCGDALMIIWPVEKGSSKEVQAVTVQMATGCGLHLLHDSRDWNSSLDFSPTTPSLRKESDRLGLHCGVASGPLHAMCVGEGDRWEFLVSGDVINEVGDACGLAKNGELYLSEESFKLVEDSINCVPGPKGFYKVDQKEGILEHIPRKDGMQLKRTWSSYAEGLTALDTTAEEVAIDTSSASHPVITISGADDLNESQMSQSSSILTFGSSPLKSPTVRPSAKGAAKMESHNKSWVGDHRRRATSDALQNLKTNFTSGGKMSMPSMAMGSSHRSITSLTPRGDANVPPRYLSLDDLKYNQQLSFDSLHLSNGGANVPPAPLAKGDSTRTFQSSNYTTDKSARTPDSLISPCVTTIDRRLPPNLSIITESPIKPAPPTPGRGKTPMSNPKSPTSGGKNSSVYSENIVEDLEDEKIFLNVDCDYDNSSGSEKQSSYSEKEEVPFFEEPEDEHVLIVKNYLAGYLRREESESLYEFEGMNEVLRCFVQESARKPVERGTTLLMAELRVVVTIFIEVIGLNKDFKSGSVRRPQKVLRFMLACLKHFGGALRQYIVDDKGCVLICAFGLPGFSHNDNCARAVETAVAVKRLLLASKLDCKIGIAEGRVYCGLVGSSERCEYAMMGASVNLAARLMGKSKISQISVTEEVYQRTFDNFVFSVMPKIRAKGYKMPISVYCPVERIQIHNRIIGDAEEGGGNARKVEEFIGREGEIRFFEAALTSFAQHSGLADDEDSLFSYLIEGDMGVGKTWLIGEVCYMASQHLDIENIMVVAASSPQSYSSTQYDTIRQLIIQIFGITPESTHFDTAPSHNRVTELTPRKFDGCVSVSEQNNTPSPRFNDDLDIDPRDLLTGDTPSASVTSISMTSLCESPRIGEEASLSPPSPETLLASKLLGITSDVHYSPSSPQSQRESGLFTLRSMAGVSKTSILSENMGSSEIKSVLGMASTSSHNINMSPQALSLIGRAPARRHSFVSTASSENHGASQHTLTCVMEWVAKNVGPEDTLTARVNTSDEAPVRRAADNASATGRSDEEANSAGRVSVDRSGSFESTTTSIVEDASQSRLSLSGGCGAIDDTAPSGPLVKVLTKRVLDMLPLLSALFPVDLPKNDEVAALSKSEKRMMLNTLLIFIVSRTFERSKSLLVVEHIQWCDHFSMYIILQALNIAKSNVFFLGTLRSSSGIKNKQEVRTRRSKYVAELVYRCNHHVIYPFTIDEIRATLESALGPIFNLANPDIMSNHNLSTILDRTDGAPLLVCCLCFEISNAIKEGSFVDIESLPCGRRDDLIDLFDLLGHSDQLILKVASVIGRSFTFQELCYLLVMMGLSACLVDLDEALLRMVETSFVEEYHMEGRTEVDAVGEAIHNFDVNSASGFSSQRSSHGEPVPQHLLRYRFTNNSVHENVYNLMLEEHREVAHTFLGAYLEPYLAQKPALFDRAVFHFIRSGNVSKKIEYLCKAAEVSRIAGNFRDVYFYFGELVKLATGLKVQDLLSFCLLSPEMALPTGADARSTVLRRMAVARHLHELPVYVCVGRRWLAGSDFKNPVYTLVEDISEENVCRWIGEMGIILFKLGALQASANLIKLSLHGMKLPVSLAPDVSRRTVGSISQLLKSGSKSISSVPSNQIQSNDISNGKGKTKAKKGMWNSLSSVFRSQAAVGAPGIHNLPDNITTLKLAMSLFEHLGMITLLHASAATTLHHLRYCGEIKAKIWHLVSSGQDRNENSVVSFIDKIIAPDEISDDAELKLRFCHTRELSSIAESIRCISYRSMGDKKVLQKSSQKNNGNLDFVLDIHENNHSHINSHLSSPSSAGDQGGSVYSLSSVSYEQTTPGATPETISSKYTGTPNTASTAPTDFKGKYIEKNGKNAIVVFDQALSLIEKAMLDASKAEFRTCMLCLRRGSVMLGCLGEEVGEASRQFVHLYKAWCSFVCGHASKCKVLLEVISKFVSVFEQSTLYKWTSELKCLKMVMNSKGTSDGLSHATDVLSKLREILKRDNPSACSSAILALGHAMERRPVEAVAYARYAILKLSTRDPVTFVGPLFIFVAGYAAAIAMELYVSANIQTSPDATPEPARNLSADFNDVMNGGSNEYFDEEWYREVQSRSYKAKRWYQAADECVTMAKQRLKVICKTAQPCLILLYRALKIKYLLCNAVYTKSISKIPHYTHFKLMSDSKTYDYNDFVFGYAFLRLEQANLSAMFNYDKTSKETSDLSRDNNVREIVQLFGTLGCSKSNLRSFGLCRFDPTSWESVQAGMRSLRSMSTTYSETSERGGSGSLDAREDLERISRIVQQYRPVKVDELMNKEIL